jgi:hypothetical protein
LGEGAAYPPHPIRVVDTTELPSPALGRGRNNKLRKGLALQARLVTQQC